MCVIYYKCVLKMNWSNMVKYREILITHLTSKKGFFICVILVGMVIVIMNMEDITFPTTKTPTEYQSYSGAYEQFDHSSLMNRNTFGNSSAIDELMIKYFLLSNSTYHSNNETELQGNLNISTTVLKIREERKRRKTMLEKYVSKNFTLVTAYWNLGSFRKGQSSTFSTDTYKKWAISFKYMLNPLVIYTDSLVFKNLMQAIRSDLSFCTKIIYVNRTKIAAFQRIDKIKEIYAQPGYPKHYPNTVRPAYAAAQHAKFNVVAETYRRGLFNTTHYGWIDVGYFRDIVNTKEYYVMVVPPDLDVNRLAFNQINGLVASADPISIFRDNMVWVGGGLFVGLGKIIDIYEKFYFKAVDYFLDIKVSNSDQQVLYSIYTTKGRQALNPPIEIQPYKSSSPGNSWFYLGFLCRKVLRISKL